LKRNFCCALDPLRRRLLCHGLLVLADIAVT